jgi:hypothetical protein
MGAAIKVLAVLGRFVQFISGVICAGILGRYVYLLDVADLSVNSKLEYALAISGIAITFSLLLIAPFAYQFWAFPFDFAMFVMWMVSFGLLDDVRLSLSLLSKSPFFPSLPSFQVCLLSKSALTFVWMRD